MQRVYCVEKEAGYHTFYLESDGETYYLFRQEYKVSVDNYYSRGVLLKDAIDLSKGHRDAAVTHTMTKLPKYFKYLESEYGARIFDKTRRKDRRVRMAA